MRLGILAATILGSALLAGAANASISFTANQGTTFNGGTVGIDRSNVNSMLDGDLNTFYSLGIGGTLTASIAPQLIASASVIEVTFGNNIGFPESAKVFLGSDSTTGTLIGELFNLASGATSTSAGGATITTIPNAGATGRTLFQIALGPLSGTSSMLHFLDTTGVNYETQSEANNSDGFDIAELRIAAVPLPAGVLLLGLGLGGLAAYRRRQAA